jgi:hypothetical protein
MIPGWFARASLVGAVLLACAGGPAFTHSGPFAYHGLLAYYLPMAIWGAWLDGHAWYMRRWLLASEHTALRATDSRARVAL